jgi:IS5 family transposase
MYQLAGKINWPLFDDAFKKHYSQKMGAPSKPIRLMVSLLILKYVRNLSDENLVEQWSENNYFQYFSGQQFFQPKYPVFRQNLLPFETA